MSVSKGVRIMVKQFLRKVYRQTLLLSVILILLLTINACNQGEQATNQPDVTSESAISVSDQAKEHYDNGVQFAMKGQFQEAIAEYRKSIEYKTNLIAETRKLLDTSETMTQVRASSLWGFISDNLNDKENKSVFPGAFVMEISLGGPNDEMSQDDQRKRGISVMLSRLEKEWKLT